jgi:putative transposase
VSEATYHRWRAQFGGMKPDDVKRLKELERENGQLKRLVADKELDEPGSEGAGDGKLLSPSRRRRGVLALQGRLGISERRACGIARQQRSTQRRQPIVVEDDAALRGRLRRLSRERPRWGYRRAHAELPGEGWLINRKRVQRV